MKLVISSDTFLKVKPESPFLLKDDEKIPLSAGESLEIEKACEHPLGHYQVTWEGSIWYCYKFNAFIEN